MTKEEKIKECYCSVLQIAMDKFPGGAPSLRAPLNLRPFQDLVSAAFLATGLREETILKVVAHVENGGQSRPMLDFNPVFVQLIKVTSSKQSGDDLLVDMVIAYQNGFVKVAREAMSKFGMALADFLPVIVEDRRREIA